MAATKNKYEVEEKYPVVDPGALEKRLADLGCRFGEEKEQVDTYFSHPQRDFLHTDEALRLRRTPTRVMVTYKGPKIDQTTKTRREIEMQLGQGETEFNSFRELLTALGFREVAEVRKMRRTGGLLWEDREVEIALDQVDGLGAFTELETVAEESDVDAARDAIRSLAMELGLAGGETRSYLELILAERS